MRYFLLSAILVVFIVSCKRESSGNNGQRTDLTGTWMLTEVKDKSTGSTISYPAGTQERIQITLREDGSFGGKTRVNLFEGGTYTVPATGRILFGSLGMMTKVAEDQLGTAFFTVLGACHLQSISPCAPSTYTINGNMMVIVSPLRYDITFVKL
ncbi:META domain-containing protein [Lacibacter sp. H407]|uniref:META domain-containing protein n=1 Tax=Lacibacter sp. H407 TaxID=3133423 RepID=UPI0030BFEA70